MVWEQNAMGFTFFLWQQKDNVLKCFGFAGCPGCVQQTSEIFLCFSTEDFSALIIRGPTGEFHNLLLRSFLYIHIKETSTEKSEYIIYISSPHSHKHAAVKPTAVSSPMRMRLPMSIQEVRAYLGTCVVMGIHCIPVTANTGQLISSCGMTSLHRSC